MSTSVEGITGIPMNAGIAGILNPIQKPTAPEQAGTEGAASAGSAAESAFGSIFNSLIQNVKDTDAEFVQAQYLLATGQLDNPAQLNLAAYKNEIAVDLLIQMRNRALDAYNELKNMSV